MKWSQEADSIKLNVPGYQVEKQEELDDINSLGLIFTHKKSGAKVVVLKNEDENKVFSVGFRTPPDAHTGVPHIIEHSVLCGSKEFPVKDPFVELVKGSLNTFLNAMTYPDKTIYPVASCNDKDFQNLMHIYLDAVFYPNIYQREEIFKQEGWHYDLQDTEAELKYNGVVYNEMKGAFSSPEQVLYRVNQQSLLPDTCYGKESGGDPDFIPTLTYENFLDFHKKFYHPVNSYIYLYGDIDMADKLNWIEEHYLNYFDRIDVDSEIEIQKPFDEINVRTEYYALSEEEELAGNDYLSLNHVIGSRLDEKTCTAFQILDYVLVSAPGAPLKQAFIDAGIGKDIIGYYDSGILQPMFTFAAKNTDESRKDEFLKLYRTTLEKLVEEGLDEKSLSAALNYYEFKYREADYGNYPKGLMYGIQILETWLYDQDKAFESMHGNEMFAVLKKEIGTGYFEQLIKQYLLDNTHASFVVLKPVKGLAAEKENKIRAELQEYKKSLTSEEIDRLVKNTKELELYQETPSTQEELKKIPMLSIEDIKKEAQRLYLDKKQIAGVPVLHHNLFTNGIGYLRLSFDMKKVPEDLLPYVGLLTLVLGYVDTKNNSFLQFSNEININTGGISTSIKTYSKVKQLDDYEIRFEVGTKVLYDQIGKAAELILELIFDSNLQNEKRLLEIIREAKSRLQMQLNSSGHVTAVGRVQSYFSKMVKANDQVKGIAFYRFLERIERNFDKESASIIGTLDQLRHFIVKKENLVISYTADESGYDKMMPAAANLLDHLSQKEITLPEGSITVERKNEGFMSSGQVQYVARGGNFRADGYVYTGVLKVLKVLLSYDYLWNNLRVKGGAYGCMCDFSMDGNTFFTSYRDPNLAETNEVYKKMPAYIENMVISSRDMTKYIIGTISGFDTPLNPSAKGLRSMAAFFSGVSMEEVQRERDEILHASEDQIRSLGKLLDAVLSQNYICVLGNDKKIEANKEMFQTLENLS